MGIRPPSSYVDYTKSYYFNALRYGDLIKSTEKDIIESLKYFNIFIDNTKYLNFSRSLIELSSTDLLNKEEEYYVGNDAIFDYLYGIKESLFEGEMEDYAIA